MSVIDEVLRNNEDYVKRFNLGHLPMPPGRQLAVLACMDARLTVEQALGLKTGDAHVIRNAGGIASVDAIRSLIISHYLLGTKEWMVINHTDCGMLTFQDQELSERLRRETGKDAVAPSHFHAFSDPEENVRRQLAKVKDHPWTPKGIILRGFVFDVKTGRLNEVKSEGTRPQSTRLEFDKVAT